MSASTYFKRRPGCSYWIIRGGVFLFLLWLFWPEISFVFQWLKDFLNVLQGQGSFDELFSGPVVAKSLYVGLNIIAAALLAWLMAYFIAEASLPVRSGSERRTAVARFREFLFGSRFPLVHVREGQLTPESEARVQNGLSGGAALVDLTSVMVLERQWTAHHADLAKAHPVVGHSGQAPVARVGHPGLVFIQRGEKLRGVASLRKQVRLNLGVLGQTSDGIELKTSVVTIFSLGQPATVLKVAYNGEPLPENLHVVNIDPASRKIKSFSDELDERDKAEIDRFAQEYLAYSEVNSALEPLERGKDHPPFTIDDERILAAVYSQARDVNDSKLDNWTDLPVLVATEIFRNMISQVKYDALYMLEDATRFPLVSEYKPRFARMLRHMGVMSYQFLQRYDGLPPEAGQRVEHRQFRISAVKELSTSKLLRDRGIKVIHAGFSELTPTDPTIRQQRLDNWRARWQQEADNIRADLDLEVMRIRSQARSEKQEELIKHLLGILKESTYSEEALALLVFQALQDLVADPNTRKLLPSETFNTLQSLRLWLLPDEHVRLETLDERLISGNRNSGANDIDGYGGDV
jgi:hypothetical protein